LALQSPSKDRDQIAVALYRGHVGRAFQQRRRKRTEARSELDDARVPSAYLGNAGRGDGAHDPF
jgi:hypothetical protein